jgi:hypothetical protein
MSRTAALLAAALLAPAALATVPATAAEKRPFPAGCGFMALTDPTAADPDTQLAEIDGGPMLLGGPTGLPFSGTLVCTIQVGGGLPGDPDTASASAHGTGVVVVPPTVVRYDAPIASYVYFCTEFVGDDGSHFYLVDTNDPNRPDYWSTDPATPCEDLVETGGNDVPPEVWELLNALACPVLLAIDARLGTELAVFWQDCEPYSPII